MARLEVPTKRGCNALNMNDKSVKWPKRKPDYTGLLRKPCRTSSGRRPLTVK